MRHAGGTGDNSTIKRWQTKLNFMKKTLLLFCFIVSLRTVFAQNKETDLILKELSQADTDISRVRLMNKILYETNALSQQERIDYSKKILDLSKKQHNKVLESIIIAELGYILAINGNKLQGSELGFIALEMALEHKNRQALGIIYQDLAVCFSNDNTKFKQYLLKALPNSEYAGDYFNLTANLSTISQYYSSIKQKDSALYYAQRAYELCLSKNIEVNLPGSLIQLAKVNYFDLNNKGIALEYMKKAMKTKFGVENADDFVNVNNALADLFHNQSMPDSAIYYNNKALGKLEKAWFIRSLKVYGLYKKIYSNINSNRALKYYKLYETTKDSIDKMSNAQQQQLLSIKKELELSKAEEERQNNLQYIFIAIGILTLIILFLLLSRSFITNTKLIQFFGIVGLLIVFEFLNLLLHPFLEKITHHSPIFMLLGLVAIAALLVPLHHKVEHWATAKLVEKNKQIRLANAKKTIEELDIKIENK